MESLASLEKALPVIGMIFVVVFCAIIVVRIIIFFTFSQAYKQYKKLAKTTKKILPQSKKKFDKVDEELLRKKLKIPRAHSAVKAELMAQGEARTGGSYELITSEEQRLDKAEMNKIEIVDIVKPIGFWTSMILGQKLTYLIQSAQILNKRGDKGFWVSMVEAKDRMAGKQHARGR